MSFLQEILKQNEKTDLKDLIVFFQLVFDKILNSELGIPWEKSKQLIDCACLGCSKMFKVDQMIKDAGIRLEGDMKNHVSIGDYMNKGYQVIVM